MVQGTGDRPLCAAIAGGEGDALLHDIAYGERLQAMAEADFEALEDLEPPLGYRHDK